jgi:hypothetical protein
MSDNGDPALTDGSSVTLKPFRVECLRKCRLNLQHLLVLDLGELRPLLVRQESFILVQQFDEQVHALLGHVDQLADGGLGTVVSTDEQNFGHEFGADGLLYRSEQIVRMAGKVGVAVGTGRLAGILDRELLVIVEFMLTTLRIGFENDSRTLS